MLHCTWEYRISYQNIVEVGRKLMLACSNKATLSTRMSMLAQYNIVSLVIRYSD